MRIRALPSHREKPTAPTGRVELLKQLQVDLPGEAGRWSGKGDAKSASSRLAGFTETEKPK